MKLAPLQIALRALFLFSVCSSSFAHDDAAGREKEFNYGYRVGYITAVREVGEGVTMCTKKISLPDVILAIGVYNKSNGINQESALSAQYITLALSAKYPCLKK